MAKSTAITDPYTKTQTLSEIATNTGLTKKDVSNVVEELSSINDRHIKKRACGKYTMPDLFMIQTTRKPATKARKGINPFTKEETIFKAKPARTVIKIRPLKKMKDMV